MATNEGSNRRAGSPGDWPDDVDGGILLQLAGYHWDLKRSLTSAAFGWNEAGPDERAAYLDELGALREKESRVWAAYLARPLNKENDHGR
jgi:hypothetical protein